tara:strand:- start:6351 stop:6545 length:195 start_codon:yes stop_codon:yes gene_type:complete
LVDKAGILNKTKIRFESNNFISFSLALKIPYKRKNLEKKILNQKGCAKHSLFYRLGNNLDAASY